MLSIYRSQYFNKQKQSHSYLKTKLHTSFPIVCVWFLFFRLHRWAYKHMLWEITFNYPSRITITEAVNHTVHASAINESSISLKRVGFFTLPLHRKHTPFLENQQITDALKLYLQIPSVLARYVQWRGTRGGWKLQAGVNIHRHPAEMNTLEVINGCFTYAIRFRSRVGGVFCIIKHWRSIRAVAKIAIGWDWSKRRYSVSGRLMCSKFYRKFHRKILDIFFCAFCRAWNSYCHIL